MQIFGFKDQNYGYFGRFDVEDQVYPIHLLLP